MRVLKNHDAVNPNVYWLTRHEGIIYEIKKNKAGFISKAILLLNQNQTKAINTQKLTGDFSPEAFEEMIESAKDYLTPPLFTIEFIEEFLIRPADTYKIMRLVGTETAAEQVKDWWKDLYKPQ